MKQPESQKGKSKSVSYTLRLPEDLRVELQSRADRDGRTLSNYIIYLLREAVRRS